MKHLFAGAVALSLLLAGAANAQTDQPRPDQPGGYQQQDHGYPQRAGDDRGRMDQHREGMDRGYDEGYRHGDGYRHHFGHRACHWRHHHRVCRWRR